jgi:hypothetical protein
MLLPFLNGTRWSASRLQRSREIRFEFDGSLEESPGLAAGRGVELGEPQEAALQALPNPEVSGLLGRDAQAADFGERLLDVGRLLPGLRTAVGAVVRAMVGSRGLADHRKPAPAGETCRQVLDDRIGEVVVRGIAREVLEGSTTIAGLSPKPCTRCSTAAPAPRPRPISCSAVAASVRFVTSRASITSETWFFTVAAEMPSASAIARFESPFAIRSSTSSWRGVSRGLPSRGPVELLLKRILREPPSSDSPRSTRHCANSFSGSSGK